MSTGKALLEAPYAACVGPAAGTVFVVVLGIPYVVDDSLDTGQKAGVEVLCRAVGWGIEASKKHLELGTGRKTAEAGLGIPFAQLVLVSQFATQKTAIGCQRSGLCASELDVAILCAEALEVHGVDVALPLPSAPTLEEHDHHALALAW